MNILTNNGITNHFLKYREPKLSCTVIAGAKLNSIYNFDGNVDFHYLNSLKEFSFYLAVRRPFYKDVRNLFFHLDDKAKRQTESPIFILKAFNNENICKF